MAMRTAPRMWLVAVGSCVALSACTASGSASAPQSATASAPGSASAASGASWSHIHGLGVDRADGALYIAAHDGIYRSTSTGVHGPVGERRQDTMGFTITGPGTFLGSGHPDPATDPSLPSPLGLVVSTDSGNSWQPVSLGGQVDFHVLRASGDTIYGVDSVSGQLLASTDAGQSWQARGQVPARDLAIDPADPSVVVATSAEGLQRSTDGGRSWAVVAPSPLPVVVDWSEQGGLYGIEGDGSVLHSVDAGSTWTRLGEVGGTPEAMTSVTSVASAASVPATSPADATPSGTPGTPGTSGTGDGGAAGAAQDAGVRGAAPSSTVLHVAVAREGEHPSIATSVDGGRTFTEQSGA